MFKTDYLQGSFEFETTVEVLPDGKVKASACGREVIAADASQALNDLNAKLNQEMEAGNFVTTMGE